MKYFTGSGGRLFVTAVLLCLLTMTGSAQILSKTITVNVNRQRLDNVLEIMSNEGNFYFSYNSSIIKRDSIVSLSVSGRTVREVLELLLGNRFEYIESGNYLIIRRVPPKLSMVATQVYTEDKVYVVSGYVMDEGSGEKVSDATIYEKRRLLSTSSDERGYFQIRLKSTPKVSALTVSKEFYEDTTFPIKPNYNQQVTVAIVPVALSGSMITISPHDYLAKDSIVVEVQIDTIFTKYTRLKDSIKVERTAVGRLLLSSKQKIQSLNLKKFITERPIQFSVVPNVGTHGKLGAQVINNFSFNIFGGYAGGVNGLEVGGLFNIDKKDVKYVQVGGLFNIVGGRMDGLQVGGLHNTVLDTVHGVQVAGINNFVKGKFSGLQVGGIYNHVGDSVKGMQVGGIANFSGGKTVGMQVGGIANFSNKEMHGMQVAGIVNVTRKTVRGVQIGGIVNYAKKLHGLQVGLINISDSSDGYSIGLINIVMKGYHKLAFSTNEVSNANVAFKSGNAKLYSILQVGTLAGGKDKLYAFGYGIGKECKLGKGWSINPEITSQYLYLGSWDYVNQLNKLHLNVSLQLGKYFSLFAGPSFAVYYSNQPTAVSGYKFSPTSYNTFKLGGNKVTGWFGWNAGIAFL
jgi:hypothetical protein